MTDHREEPAPLPETKAGPSRGSGGAVLILIAVLVLGATATAIWKGPAGSGSPSPRYDPDVVNYPTTRTLIAQTEEERRRQPAHQVRLVYEEEFFETLKATAAGSQLMKEGFVPVPGTTPSVIYCRLSPVQVAAPSEALSNIEVSGELAALTRPIPATKALVLEGRAKNLELLISIRFHPSEDIAPGGRGKFSVQGQVRTDVLGRIAEWQVFPAEKVPHG